MSASSPLWGSSCRLEAPVTSVRAAYVRSIFHFIIIPKGFYLSGVYISHCLSNQYQADPSIASAFQFLPSFPADIPVFLNLPAFEEA
jgi:hypothetical protein